MKLLATCRRLAPRAALLLALAVALTLAACDHDIDITAPPLPTPGFIPSNPGGASQTIEISGTLRTVHGSCFEATILYDGQELAGARTACDAPGGCARLELRAAAIPRSRGHHTIAFQVLRQSSPRMDYFAEGSVLIDMQGSLQLDMVLGPKAATLESGESVSFDASFL